MKRVRLFAISIIGLGMLAVSSHAQTATPTKIAVIDAKAFYAKDKGISRIAAEYRKLELEFAPAKTQLENLNERVTKLQTELRTMQENRGIPVDENSFNSKVAEYEKLGRELKFRNDEYNLSVEVREGQLMEPVLTDITKRVSEFAKRNGYDIVLNTSQLQQGGMLLHLNETLDITAAFITFYNALPARTASLNE